MVNVKWSENPKSKYLSSILITTKNNHNAMLEIMQKASTSNISIDNMKTLSKTDFVVYEVDLWVTSLERLNNFIRDINQLGYVETVERIMK